MELKVGDVVQLKTGGPKMTVNRVGPYKEAESDDVALSSGEVETIWFTPARDKEGNAVEGMWDYASSHRFGAAALLKVDP